VISVSWSLIKIERINFIENRDKLSILKKSFKGFTESDFEKAYNETSDFIKNLPLTIKYSTDEGLLNNLFDSIVLADRVQKKDFSRILHDFIKNNKRTPYTSIALLRLGAEKIFESKYEEAEKLFDSAYEAEENIAGVFGFLYKNRASTCSILMQRGIAKMLNRKFQEAQQDFELAITRIPESDLQFFTKIRLKGRIVESLLLRNMDDKAEKIMEEIKGISQNTEMIVRHVEKFSNYYLNLAGTTNESELKKQKQRYIDDLSKIIKGVYDRLKLYYDLPFEHRKVIRLVKHYRNLRGELRGEFGPALKPSVENESVKKKKSN
jgi:tetratricopeptide (TPR) repeat protein